MTEASAQTAWFWQALAQPARAHFESPAAAEQMARGLYQRARGRWPQFGDLGRPFELRLAHLFARAHPAAESVHAEDLLLCVACEEGLPGAIAAFRQEYLGAVERKLKQAAFPATVVEETLATLQERSLVALPGGRPKVAEYAGRGGLTGWLEVSAFRIASRLMRQARGATPTELEQLAGIADHRADLELDLLRQQFRPAFRRAFVDAWGALSAKERNLLRYHYLERLSTDQLARLYAVHRATAVRWLARARHQLMGDTRQHFLARAAVRADEVSSLFRYLRSELEVSLRTLKADLAE